MDKTTYQVSGRVTRTNDDAGIHGLCVEVWEKDRLDEHFLGSDLTRGDGSFKVRINSMESTVPLEVSPELYLVIKD